MARNRPDKIVQIACDNGLHRAFKMKCAEQGRSMSSMTRLLIASYLEHNPPGEVSNGDWAKYLEKEKQEQFKYL